MFHIIYHVFCFSGKISIKNTIKMRWIKAQNSKEKRTCNPLRDYGLSFLPQVNKIANIVSMLEVTFYNLNNEIEMIYGDAFYATSFVHI